MGGLDTCSPQFVEEVEASLSFLGQSQERSSEMSEMRPTFF